MDYALYFLGTNLWTVKERTYYYEKNYKYSFGTLYAFLVKYSSFCSRKRYNRLITNNADNMTTQQKRYLFEIKDQVNSVFILLQDIKKLGFNSLKDVDRIVDQLRSYEIKLELFGHS